MLHWALVFLVVALIAGVLGFTGVAGTAANILSPHLLPNLAPKTAVLPATPTHKHTPKSASPPLHPPKLRQNPDQQQ
jgi:hypothetical protein